MFSFIYKAACKEMHKDKHGQQIYNAHGWMRMCVAAEKWKELHSSALCKQKVFPIVKKGSTHKCTSKKNSHTTVRMWEKGMDSSAWEKAAAWWQEGEAHNNANKKLQQDEFFVEEMKWNRQQHMQKKFSLQQ